MNIFQEIKWTARPLCFRETSPLLGFCVSLGSSFDPLGTLTSYKIRPSLCHTTIRCRKLTSTSVMVWSKKHEVTDHAVGPTAVGRSSCDGGVLKSLGGRVELGTVVRGGQRQDRRRGGEAKFGGWVSGSTALMD
jgi:hypothetical protein